MSTREGVFKKGNMTDEQDIDFDFEDDDEEDDGSPDYYECLCCNYSCGERSAWGGQCPKCGTHMEEGYF